MKKTLFIVCILLVVILASGIAFTQKIKEESTGGPLKVSDAPAPAVQQISRAVVLEKVTRSQLEKSKQYPGTVNACKETRLAFRVGGPLIRVNVKPGDRVQKGDVLMQIDPQDFKDNISVLDAQLTGSLARLDNARQDFDRMQQLFKEKVTPQADFDHAITGRHTAEAAVRTIRAQLEIARHQLDYTTLRAPYDGIITQTYIENFEMVAPGQVMVGLHDISHLEIKINVPENEIITHPLVAGTEALVRFSSLGREQFPVTLKEWNTSADKATGTYGTTFTLPRPPGIQILPGMTAEIEWPCVGNQNQTIAIPAKAIVNDNTGAPHVWRFDPATSTASRVPVKTGQLYGTSRIVIESGLTSGDLIVTDGVDFITEAMKLAVTHITNAGTSRNDSQGNIQ